MHLWRGCQCLAPRSVACTNSVWSRMCRPPRLTETNLFGNTSRRPNMSVRRAVWAGVADQMLSRAQATARHRLLWKASRGGAKLQTGAASSTLAGTVLTQGPHSAQGLWPQNARCCPLLLPSLLSMLHQFLPVPSRLSDPQGCSSNVAAASPPYGRNASAAEKQEQRNFSPFPRPVLHDDCTNAARFRASHQSGQVVAVQTKTARQPTVAREPVMARDRGT